ncbi:hypothetical protein BCU93_04945 [Vibrio breoganii]|nr:hypothetical protein BCU93_04945 [Vibrio breoganii]PMM44248.1 hypothetical protein BCT52_12185 [Vibrio breoganii]
MPDQSAGPENTSGMTVFWIFGFLGLWVCRSWGDLKQDGILGLKVHLNSFVILEVAKQLSRILGGEGLC